MSFSSSFYLWSEKWYYLGSVGGPTPYTIETIREKGRELLHSLSSQAISLSSQFQKEKKADISFFFETNTEGSLKIYTVVSSKPLELEIFRGEKVQPNDQSGRRYGIRVPAYCYDLSMEFLFLCNTRSVFLALCNYFLEMCTEKEHEELLQGDVYLRFMFHHDDAPLPPYAYGYLRNLNTCLPSHRLVLQSCPPTHLPCEFNGPERGYFIFVSKEKWKRREIIGIKDMITGD